MKYNFIILGVVIILIGGAIWFSSKSSMPQQRMSGTPFPKAGESYMYSGTRAGGVGVADIGASNSDLIFGFPVTSKDIFTSGRMYNGLTVGNVTSDGKDVLDWSGSCMKPTKMCANGMGFCGNYCL